MKARARQWVVVVVVVVVCGCERAVEAPGYHADVAPLLARSCVPCHDGAGGQRDFRSFDAVVEQRELMLAAMASGLMPPQGIDRSGACGDYRGPRPLDDDDIALFSAWIDAGAAAGPALPAPPASVDDGERDDVDDELLVAPISWIPRADRDAALDQQRCFTLAGPTQTGSALVGFDVDAANHLHHLMLFTVPASDDDDDDDDGWACDGSPGPDATLVATWTPGAARVWFPAGTGAPLGSTLGSTLVMQLHSHGADVDAADDTRLRLFLSHQALRPLAHLPIHAQGFTLPPGQALLELTRTTTTTTTLEVFGVLPHMHAAGRSISLTRAAGCVVDVPRFDYGWQEAAWLREPVLLPAGTTLTLTCGWSTSDRATPVRQGEASDDEMCTVFLLAAAR